MTYDLKGNPAPTQLALCFLPCRRCARTSHPRTVPQRPAPPAIAFAQQHPPRQQQIPHPHALSLPGIVSPPNPAKQTTIVFQHRRPTHLHEHSPLKKSRPGQPFPANPESVWTPTYTHSPKVRSFLPTVFEKRLAASLHCYAAMCVCVCARARRHTPYPRIKSLRYNLQGAIPLTSGGWPPKRPLVRAVNN